MDDRRYKTRGFRFLLGVGGMGEGSGGGISTLRTLKSPGNLFNFVYFYLLLCYIDFCDRTDKCDENTKIDLQKKTKNKKKRDFKHNISGE